MLLHGGLFGMANHFTARVDQHLRIGIRAIELCREHGDRSHSRSPGARRGGFPVGGTVSVGVVRGKQTGSSRSRSRATVAPGRASVWAPDRA